MKLPRPWGESCAETMTSDDRENRPPRRTGDLGEGGPRRAARSLSRSGPVAADSSPVGVERAGALWRTLTGCCGKLPARLASAYVGRYESGVELSFEGGALVHCCGAVETRLWPAAGRSDLFVAPRARLSGFLAAFDRDSSGGLRVLLGRVCVVRGVLLHCVVLQRLSPSGCDFPAGLPPEAASVAVSAQPKSSVSSLRRLPPSAS